MSQGEGSMVGESTTRWRRQAVARRQLLRGATVGAGALWLAACGGGSNGGQAGGASGASPAAGGTPAAGQPKKGGTLRVSQPQDIAPATTPHVLSPTNYVLYNTVYDLLVSYDTKLSPRPELATSWEWSPDFLQLTLKLRQGVTFHTGRPFTSEDAKFNLERIREPAVGSQWRNYALMMKLETPDPATLVIKYDAPRKSSFDALAGTFMADRDTIDQTKEGKSFVGTGPFRFKEWTPNDHFTVVRNPGYWQAGKPYLDQVETRITPDAQSALVNLESGGVDWMAGVEAQDARRLEKDRKFQILLTEAGGSFWYVGLDVKVPALADKRVRQAFAYALDRKRMVESVLFGFGRPASILWPRHSPAYDKAQDETYSYDLQKARQLLQAAGWDPNTTVSYTLSNSYPPTHPMTEVYQQDLAGIGVKVAIQKFEHPVYLPKLIKGQFGGAWMSTIGFMNLSPATFFLSAFPVRVPNSSNFDTPRYKALIEQSLGETDDQKLKAVLKDLTQIMLDEAFVIAVAENEASATGVPVARSTVRNVTWNVSGWVAFEELWLEK